MNDTPDVGFDQTTVVGYRPTMPGKPAGSPPDAPPAPPPLPPAALVAPVAPAEKAPAAVSGSRVNPTNDPRRQRFSSLGLTEKAQAAASPSQPVRAEPGPSGPRIVPLATRAPKQGKLDAGSLAEFGSGQGEEFVSAGLQLLVIVAQIRDGVAVSDLAAFRREVTDHLKRFDDQAVKLGAKATDVSAARYVLCALVDETVMTTAWGESSDWTSNSLLNQFHGETWGGERVFEILETAKKEPGSHLALLRLIDRVLILGFEGVYRVRENGRELLESLRDEVGRIISAQIGRPEAELSGSWRGVEAAKRRLRQYVPVWVVLAVTGVLLVGFYGVQQFRLLTALDSVSRQLERIGTERPSL